jgi:uncharacterized protein DUF3891
MIVRDEGDTFLLITQPNHAGLSEQIGMAMRSEPALHTRSRDAILLAMREHDNGWAEVDAEPDIEPATGRPRDFMSGPALVRYELWLRGITRAARMDPRAGALVAEHALTVYEYRRGAAEWQSFFDSITPIRDDLLRQIGMLTGAARDAFQQEYRCVQLADALSLQFCNGWNELSVTLEYQAIMRGPTLLISPDPFDGATVPLRVLGRRIPARRYQDDGDLRETIATVTPQVITGSARGVSDQQGDLLGSTGLPEVKWPD